MCTYTPAEPAPAALRTPAGPANVPVILLVEDDQGDQILIQEALRGTPTPKRIELVSDGEEALEYLFITGRYADPSTAPRPDLILLDLNMPRLGGKEVAVRLKSDSRLKSIPIVAFTTSCREEDVAFCYGVGVNSYVQKPTDFDRLEQVLRCVEQYWFEISQRVPAFP